jgi:8-amino-7-oxononanoate synthase
LNDFLHKKIQERATNGALRVLHSLEGKIDFCSNDYLGLSNFDIKTFDKRSSGEGSRLIAGSNKASESAENTLASFFKSESALIFNSGYDANLGLFSSLSTKNTLIIFDEYIHASVRDGIRLGLGKSFHFKHNDYIDLKRIISSNFSKFETLYVVVESLYSMGGDLAPLVEITEICNEFKAHLIVDEAHAGGVYGKEGGGIVDELGLIEKTFARVFTFGKGFGSHGACVLGSNVLKKYLINFARSFIYTTALPSSCYERIDFLFASNTYIIEENNLILRSKIDYFIEKTKSFERESASNSPIQIFLLSQFDKQKLVENLKNTNIAIKPIFSPTVPIEKECLRICIHSFNTEDEIDKLIMLLFKILC